jgi:hypothetical protein
MRSNTSAINIPVATACTVAPFLPLQLTLPTRSTNMSFIKLTNQNGIKPQKVYEVRLYNTLTHSYLL